MRILGIKTLDMKENMLKTLKSNTWYPIGDVEEPTADRKLAVPAVSMAARSLYQKDGYPQITVSGIVGKNGWGKSTLLDLIYRVINNFAYRVLVNANKNRRSRILRAENVRADLYYELNDKVMCIHCYDKMVELTVASQPGDEDLLTKENISFKQLLSPFFYTIVSNYSTYAFNEDEYTINKTNTGEWLSRLFHKNDAYLCPLVLMPYRKKGQMDMHRELDLGKQRVMSMALFSYSQKTQFIEGYDPQEINFTYDLNYSSKVTESMEGQPYFPVDEVPLFIQDRLKHYLQKTWERHLSGNLKQMLHKKAVQQLRNFLVHKTLKIASVVQVSFPIRK